MKNKATSAPRRKSKKRYNKFMKITRRIHMYLGLILVPWVILFGISGFLFNHVSIFWGGPVETIADFTAYEFPQSSVLPNLDPNALAKEIIDQINDDLPAEENFTLAGSASITNELKLSGKSKNGSINFYLDLEDGNSRIVSINRSSPKQENPLYHNTPISLASIDIEALSKGAATLVKATGIKLENELSTSGRGSNSQLRFTLKDSSNQEWYTVYDIAKQTLTGRSADSATGFGFRNAVTRLHRTHVYPSSFNAKWVWVLLGDLTALSMVMWGTTGLIMWWQIQPSRVLGTVFIFIAAIAAFFIFAKNLEDMAYAPVANSQRN